MQSVLDLLRFLEANWATLVAIATALFGLYQAVKREVKNWKAKSEEEKEAALKAAQEKAIQEARKALEAIVLKWCADAEILWADSGSKLGPVKRSEVIAACFEQYPILLTVTDQDELMEYIDKLINQALETVRKTIRVDAA